jgi:hypothetical protein
MQDMRLEWRDAEGNPHAIQIVAGQAHMGHLAGLLLGNMADEIHIYRVPRAKVAAEQHESANSSGAEADSDGV